MSTKQFFYVMVAAAVAGFGAIIGSFYWGSNMLDASAKKVADLQTERDVAQEKIVALRSAQRGSSLTDNATQLLDTLLPDQKKQETLIADVIFTASAEADIPIESIGSITFAASGEPSDLSGTEQFKQVPGVLSYPFDMSVDNISYDTLLKLLLEIETNGRLVQIDNLQISPDKAVPGNISNVSLTMKAFLNP